MQQQQAQLAQQAQQAAQQGQQQYNYDVGQQNQASNDFKNFQGQATQANQNVQDYSKYLQGEGSGTNLYNKALSDAQQQEGFDPRVLATATQNLTQGQNALYQLNQASQSSSGGYGLSGAQLGNFYASQAQPLSNQIQTQGQAVGNLSNLLGMSQNQANQSAGLGVQGEKTTADTLNQAFANAQSQASQAQQQMQFYGQLAQQQGGLNSKQAADYSAAINAYTQAAAAMRTADAAMQQAAASTTKANAQAALAGSQTAFQNLKNQYTQGNMDAVFKTPTPQAPQPTPQPQQSQGGFGNILSSIGRAGSGLLKYETGGLF